MDITLPLVDHDGLDAGDLGDGHGNEFSVNLSFQVFFHMANISLDTNNSFSGGEIYCSTCYTREFGPGGRSKFGEKTEVQD